MNTWFFFWFVKEGCNLFLSAVRALTWRWLRPSEWDVYPSKEEEEEENGSETYTLGWQGNLWPASRDTDLPDKRDSSLHVEGHCQQAQCRHRLCRQLGKPSWEAGFRPELGARRLDRTCQGAAYVPGIADASGMGVSSWQHRRRALARAARDPSRGCRRYARQQAFRWVIFQLRVERVMGRKSDREVICLFFYALSWYSPSWLTGRKTPANKQTNALSRLCSIRLVLGLLTSRQPHMATLGAMRPSELIYTSLIHKSSNHKWKLYQGQIKE